jgi:hypothetical protein
LGHIIGGAAVADARDKASMVKSIFLPASISLVPCTSNSGKTYFVFQVLKHRVLFFDITIGVIM